MTKHAVRTFSRFLMLMSAFISVTSAQSLVFYGNAIDPDTGTLLYQEVHTLRLDENRVPLSETVDYRLPDGTLLGTKDMRYGSLSQPDYTVSFESRPVSEIVNVNDRQVRIERTDEKVLPRPDGPFAVDGGFHYFILQNFTPLLNGENIDFEFLSAGRGDFIPLTIRPVDQTSNQLTLELTLQNFFLSKLVKPIILTYSTPTRQLLSYSGLTNVPDDQGKLYSATINYQYPNDMVSVVLPGALTDKSGNPTTTR